MRLAVLYRGPLSSCNYDCIYCPFAKHRESSNELALDRAALERFTARIAELDGVEWRVLFTPWGEALIRRWYRDAIAALSRMPHVRRAAIQTNLSVPPQWLEAADPAKVGIWATYHPCETTLERFAEQALAYQKAGVSLSVGVVGVKEHFEPIAALRERLPSSIYVWVNAFKRSDGYYTPADEEFLKDVDPLFPLNNRRHASLGLSCATGEEAFSVDGDGVMRRCHFVDEPIGDFFTAAWGDALRPRSCPNQTCGCHIGYVHLRPLNLYGVFGDGLMERVPSKLPPSAFP
jgi:hypothetical protein